MRRRSLSGSRASRGALLLIPLFAAAAPPAPEVSIALAPPYIEKLIAEGSKASDTISFTNQGTVPVLVTVDFADYDVNESGEVSEAPPGVRPTSLIPYLRVSPMSVRVAPSQQISFRYAVEPRGPFQQLRAMIYFSSKPEVDEKPNQVLMIPRMGVPLYVESRKSEPASLAVEGVTLTRAGDKQDLLTLALDVKNEGERNLRPQGYVEVRSKASGFAKDFEFNEGREPVLPKQKRHWELKFGPVPSEELSVRIRFAVSPRSWHESKHWIPAAGG